jgi:hypothetical protein
MILRVGSKTTGVGVRNVKVYTSPAWPFARPGTSMTTLRVECTRSCGRAMARKIGNGAKNVRPSHLREVTVELLVAVPQAATTTSPAVPIINSSKMVRVRQIGNCAINVREWLILAVFTAHARLGAPMSTLEVVTTHSVLMGTLEPSQVVRTSGGCALNVSCWRLTEPPAALPVVPISAFAAETTPSLVKTQTQ